MENSVIQFDHVGKVYRLGAINNKTLIEDIRTFINNLTRKRIYKNNEYTNNRRFVALDNVSLEVKRGEALGIIGHNGAGKSTMLKLLSRVTMPSSGEIRIKGRIASMLEVGTGFHSDLTGRENIYLNGTILGMSRKEIDKKVQNIIDFSECEEFIDTPVKRYSSGMYVKLAFSVAVHLNADILIMDEVLAVGDVTFQRKCIDRMLSIVKDNNKTVLFVSHNLKNIRELCSRCVVMEHGRLVYDGGVEDAIAVYENAKRQYKTTKYVLAESDMTTVSNVRISELEFKDNPDCCYEAGDTMHIRLKWYLNKAIPEGFCARVRLMDYDRRDLGVYISEHIDAQDVNCQNEMIFTFKLPPLVGGIYQLYFEFFADNTGSESLAGTLCRYFPFECRNEHQSPIANSGNMQFEKITVQTRKVQ